MADPVAVRLGGACSLQDLGAMAVQRPRPEGAGLLPDVSFEQAASMPTTRKMGTRAAGSQLDRPTYFILEAKAGVKVEDLHAQISRALNPGGQHTAAEVGAAFGLEELTEGTFRLEIPVAENDLRRRSYGSCGLFYDLAYQLAQACEVERVDPDVRHSIWVEPQVSTLCNVGVDAAPDDRSWSFDLIDVPDAVSAGHHDGLGVRVAHIDTGHTGHPELDRANTFDLGLDLDVEAEPDDDNAEDPMPGGNSHGTGTASVITSNHFSMARDHRGILGEGIRGIAPAARIISVRAIDSVVVFGSGNLIKAVDHAINKGAHVITMSLGGLFLFGLQKTINEAVKRNIIVVAAAGNCVRFVVAPASYNACIAAGGCNSELKPWKGSSRGKRVDLCGPAENVWRAAFNKTTAETIVEPGEGTSFAAPAIAGVAALWLAKHGRDQLIAKYAAAGLTVQDVYRHLLRSTATTPPGWNTRKFGAGILNARALLAAAPPEPADVGADPDRFEMMREIDVFDHIFEDVPGARAALQRVVGPARPLESLMNDRGGELNRIFMENAQARERLADLASGAPEPEALRTAEATVGSELSDILNRNASDNLAGECNWR